MKNVLQFFVVVGTFGVALVLAAIIINGAGGVPTGMNGLVGFLVFALAVGVLSLMGIRHKNLGKR